MKKAIVFLLALSCLFGGALFSGSDVGDLQPVGLVFLSCREGWVTVRTDTEDVGVGATLDSALNALKDGAMGELFLETADVLLVHESAEHLILPACHYLRPSCRVCLTKEEVDIEKASRYFRTHPAPTSLRDIRAGETQIAYLTERGAFHVENEP